MKSEEEIDSESLKGYEEMAHDEEREREAEEWSEALISDALNTSC